MPRRPRPIPQEDPALPPRGVLLGDDDGGHVYCHVCGRGYRALGTHARRAHGLSADAYREQFDLGRELPLCAPQLSELLSARAVTGAYAANLEAARRDRPGPLPRPRGLPARLSTKIALSRQFTGRLMGVLPPAARAIAEGRRPPPVQRPSAGRARGERNGMAKLREDQVREIRARIARGGVTKRALGREYGVSEVLIGKVVRGEVWRHLPVRPAPGAAGDGLPGAGGAHRGQDSRERLAVPGSGEEDHESVGGGRHLSRADQDEVAQGRRGSRPTAR